MTAKEEAGAITLFLCGDVMIGRGIDQILPYPGKSRIFEPVMRSATDYVTLAEEATGPIPRGVDFAYVWGDALAKLERVRPDARIVNLETAVTLSDERWPGKGIGYRMHPANVPCLTAAGIDCCVLANNHVLDWGRAGLVQTLATLHDAGIRTAGAGRDAEEAAAPAVLPVAGKGRVLVFGFGMPTGGVPVEWAAAPEGPGVSFLRDLSGRSLDLVARRVREAKRAGDVVVASIHWGANFGFGVSAGERAFARGLVETAGVDVVHGHSSHHVKGIEIYRDRLILYGCGDFLNDYEGIGGHESYRGDLSLMYFPKLDPRTGRLLDLLLTPTAIRHFRVNRAPGEGTRWLETTLAREGRQLGTRVEREPDGQLRITRRNGE